jgi:hypothetical protein
LAQARVAGSYCSWRESDINEENTPRLWVNRGRGGVKYEHDHTIKKRNEVSALSRFFRAVAHLRLTSQRLGVSGGFHYLSCGRQTFNFPQNFPRGYCRRCAKPQVICRPSI